MNDTLTATQSRRPTDYNGVGSSDEDCVISLLHGWITSDIEQFQFDSRRKATTHDKIWGQYSFVINVYWWRR